MGLAFADLVELPQVVLSELTTANAWPPGQMVAVSDQGYALYVSTGSTWNIAAANGNAVHVTGNETIAGIKTFTNDVSMNGSGFTEPFDAALWVAPTPRASPTVQSQGLYVQHRVSGDAGGFVHDAAASELRLSGITNAAGALVAHEDSLVVTGGANTMADLRGLTVNFHTEGTPSGTATAISLIRSQTVPALTGTITVDTIYGLYVESQSVAMTNYSLFVAGGNSVVAGNVVPKDVNTVGLNIRGLTNQVAALLAVTNNTPTTLFTVNNNATAGLGGAISGAAFWVNNNLASTGVVVMRVRASSSQDVSISEWQDSSANILSRIDKSGYVMTRKNAAPADGDLANGELASWVDTTPGSTKVMFKAKDSGGTVRTGSVSLT